ncbi:hypothetical protein [Pseudomonas syringae]|uniref:hypothetical protein n=1 Tax=Pseudomonas syringae TaxID=317 RepID=UPI000E32198F|nr:hypothetical protein [Pseudomonas syringae]
MISRFKWYSVSLPCSVGEALQRLEEGRYDPSQRTGFIVDAGERSFQFIWKTSIYATVIDSSGSSSREEITSVCSQKIQVLGEEQIFFRLEDPPRSSKELLNALDKIIGFGFSCEQVVVTDELIRNSIEPFHSITLNTLKLSGAISSIAAIARVEIASKEGIDQESIENFGLSQSLIEAGTYSVRYKGSSGQVGFTRTGLCKISGELTARIKASIESNLINFKTRTFR